MTEVPQTPTPPRLRHEWALCAIAAAAARFIPLPFLDDLVKENATRVAVIRTLQTHGRTYPSGHVQPLYGSLDGCAVGCLKFVLMLPVKLLLYPVRKFIAIFGAVRGVPTDLMRVLLLGRTVHRCLERGLLSGEERAGLEREALRIRIAFDRAIEGMNLRLLTSALSDGLTGIKGLSAAAISFARRSFGRDAVPEQSDLDPEDGRVEEGAQQVEAVLDRPEVEALMAEFDARFDALLASSPLPS